MFPFEYGSTLALEISYVNQLMGQSEAKIPKAPSKGEEALALHLKASGIDFDREVRFAPPRKWRFDFVIKGIPIKLAIEVDGGTFYGKSRHSSAEGFERDIEKLNTATMLGWAVMRFTTQQVNSLYAIEQIKKAVLPHLVQEFFKK